mmetsp:Transcript_9960/g.15323  ORF Transcript_9960/g.15323 Transcript_9960/m.15323 type:complete len:90 (-) Transcript_9960:89-358(-)
MPSPHHAVSTPEYQYTTPSATIRHKSGARGPSVWQCIRGCCTPQVESGKAIGIKLEPRFRVGTQSTMCYIGHVIFRLPMGQDIVLMELL